MNNNVAAQHENYGYMLMKDGKESFCPFQQLFAYQTNLGGLGYTSRPCCTICPMASLDIEKGIYTTNCGASKNQFQVTVQNLPPVTTPHIIGQ